MKSSGEWAVRSRILAPVTDSVIDPMAAHAGDPVDRSQIPPALADARSLVAALLDEGVREAVLCPGSRSAPLADALADAAEANALSLRVVLDERSAGFIALGAARAHALTGASRCAAVVTTSGTAVSNLHPAVSEADAAGIPLLVISADRPHELVGTGASQTTEQTALLSPALRLAIDLPADLSADLGSAAARAAIAGQVRRAVAAATGTLSRDPGPAQINARFRPPLAVEGAASATPPASGAPEVRAAGVGAPVPAPQAEGVEHDGRQPPEGEDRGIVVAGDTAHPAVGALARCLAEHLHWPLLAEPTSHARSGPQALPRYAELLATGPGRELAGRADHLIVVGHPSLSRSVTALLGSGDLEITVLSERARWTDVSGRAHRVIPVDVPGPSSAGQASSRAVRLATTLGRRRAVEALPEPDRPGSADVAADAAVKAVWEASLLPGAPTLLVGSSMTVRRLDRLARPGSAAPQVVANRGLAGIDGTIATGIGLWMASGEPVRAIMGDLAFLHDAMSMGRGLREAEADFQAIVVDDGGGAIFSRLEYAHTAESQRFERLFTTPQCANISELAAALGARVRIPEDVPALQTLLAEPVGGLSVVIWTVEGHMPNARTT